MILRRALDQVDTTTTATTATTATALHLPLPSPPPSHSPPPEAAAATAATADASAAVAVAPALQSRELPWYTREQVAEHNSADDCWFILEDKVCKDKLQIISSNSNCIVKNSEYSIEYNVNGVL